MKYKSFTTKESHDLQLKDPKLADNCQSKTHEVMSLPLFYVQLTNQ